MEWQERKSTPMDWAKGLCHGGGDDDCVFGQYSMDGCVSEGSGHGHYENDCGASGHGESGRGEHGRDLNDRHVNTRRHGYGPRGRDLHGHDLHGHVHHENGRGRGVHGRKPSCQQC